jgi:hypothetical protein
MTRLLRRYHWWRIRRMHEARWRREDAAREAALRDENDALIEDNRELRADLARSEAETNHALLERDVVLDDNLRMHKTLQRHMRQLKGAA